VDEDALATEIIRRVGPGGTFLMEDHTLQHMRDFWYSPLIDRQRYAGWEAAGRQTMFQRIQGRVQEILASHTPMPLAPEIASYLDDAIAGEDEKALRKEKDEQW
jgi:trimethylamine--corrinoid protein Co-methyltransferase